MVFIPICERYKTVSAVGNQADEAATAVHVIWRQHAVRPEAFLVIVRADLNQCKAAAANKQR